MAQIEDTGKIIDSYSTANVQGINYVGGLPVPVPEIGLVILPLLLAVVLFVLKKK